MSKPAHKAQAALTKPEERAAYLRTIPDKQTVGAKDERPDALRGEAVILSPGIHDISAEDYHADPAPAPSLSSSIAKLIIQKPMGGGADLHRRAAQHRRRGSAMNTRSTVPTLTAATRKAISDWLASGYAVTVKPNGELVVAPAKQTSKDPFDSVDFGKK